MATGSDIRTWFDGQWHEGDIAVMRAADHGAWLGSTVFDGARYAHGVAPDLDLHCARLNRSAEAMMIRPSVTAEEMVRLVQEGLALYPADAALYIRPMYWAIDAGAGAIAPDPQGATGFCICLEAVPLAPEDATVRLTTTRFHRPVLADAVLDAKAGALYPNNARMIMEARSKGFDNALVADAMGNVAETATANVFIVKDGVVATPIPNGTFLAGITRNRHIALLRQAGVTVEERVLTFDEVRAADEVFLTGNMSKVTPVTAFDEVQYQPGPVAAQARRLYWDWALSGA
ncbi:branched-chain amino acid aminotransferase [Pseudoroseicyclus aestuarii]|uniref:Probable branched-chain-amino-acid aminotransferase n=1 Tax=Pseudoroseicyclus aestuarii TaxID=1795041 RepID=A0A318STI4_9RHOB|nr:branched-chain amino acid aminotransferase [Pseudoroseicyclus aestuarii]PYE84782.1 branched-chain amino acid aminotransferase [Pseudoroseicyclus aestuarii]